MLISACGGSAYHAPATTPPPPSDIFDLQAGIKNMVANGLNSNVTLSGTVIANGVSTPFTGTGTFTRLPATTATFNSTAAMSQATIVAGTITTGGQASPYSTSVTDYYASSDGAFLGEVSASEYDVAQTPIEFPDSVVPVTSQTLGTLSRYTDSTMSVSLGTAQLSYSATAATATGGPIGVALTTKILDTQSNLVETDVTNYSMTSSNVITLSGASGQNQSGTITITAQ